MMVCVCFGLWGFCGCEEMREEGRRERESSSLTISLFLFPPGGWCFRFVMRCDWKRDERCVYDQETGDREKELVSRSRGQSAHHINSKALAQAHICWRPEWVEVVDADARCVCIGRSSNSSSSEDCCMSSERMWVRDEQRVSLRIHTVCYAASSLLPLTLLSLSSHKTAGNSNSSNHLMEESESLFSLRARKRGTRREEETGRRIRSLFFPNSTTSSSGRETVSWVTDAPLYSNWFRLLYFFPHISFSLISQNERWFDFHSHK